MFTEVFGKSPRVKLLDFLADHIDYDYTISQLEEFAGISRHTIYRLIPQLEAEKIISPPGRQAHPDSIDSPRETRK